jgi:hypothetical protein
VFGEWGVRFLVKKRYFLSSEMSRLLRVPLSELHHFSPGVKQPARAVNHLTPTSAKVKNE